MFKSISFAHQNTQDQEHPIDLGSLVECMLFYQNTTVIANRGIFNQLLREFGIDALIELIECGLLNIIFTESFLGIRTETYNGRQLYDPVIFSSPQHTAHDVFRQECTNVTGKSGKGRRVAKRLGKIVKIVHHDKIIADDTKKSILNQQYVNSAVKHVIKNKIPQIGEIDNLIFETKITDKRIEVNSNLNFISLNKAYQSVTGTKDTAITPAHILSNILNAESELYFSSRSLSELATNPLSSSLIEQKISFILGRSKQSEKQRCDFQEFVFGSSKTIREAVNNKTISINEILKLLKHAQQFKKWIVGIDPDEDLIRNYYNEVTKKTFVDKLPGKSTRWFIFTGLGAIADSIATGGIGTATGVALGLLDTFYMDKLLQGWKPSHFIEEKVGKLLKNDT